MNKPRILFWHRKDLRIFDNQALIKAFSLSNAITSTYILDKNIHKILMQIQELGF